MSLPYFVSFTKENITASLEFIFMFALFAWIVCDHSQVKGTGVEQEIKTTKMK